MTFQRPRPLSLVLSERMGLAEPVAMILIFGSVSYKIFSQLFQSAAYWISSKKQYTVSLAEILERKVSMTVFTEHNFKSG